MVNGGIATYNCAMLAELHHSLTTWYFISANGSNSTIGSVNGTDRMMFADSGKYQISDINTSPDEYGRLLVRDVQFEDRGTYVCLAENRFGPDTASATLSVQGKSLRFLQCYIARVHVNTIAVCCVSS